MMKVGGLTCLVESDDLLTTITDVNCRELIHLSGPRCYYKCTHRQKDIVSESNIEPIIPHLVSSRRHSSWDVQTIRIRSNHPSLCSSKTSRSVNYLLVELMMST
jgi:hypothetical protein